MATRKYGIWGQDGIENALQAYCNGDSDLNEVSRQYTILKPTLKPPLEGENVTANKITSLFGRSTTLPPDVKLELARYILKLENLMLSFTINDVKGLAFEIVIQKIISQLQRKITEIGVNTTIVISTIKLTVENVLLVHDGHTTQSNNLETLVLQLTGHGTHRRKDPEKWLRTNLGMKVTQLHVDGYVTEAYGRAATIGGFPDCYVFRASVFATAENFNQKDVPVSQEIPAGVTPNNAVCSIADRYAADNSALEINWPE
ncbi:hypothetical protein J6590_086873 [Homalodisca vitripennis]|nr:hypothetical protein J6590_101278 [Homalodisca vitripennis]KAG8314694.1 hypothetical protein J6590_086873 [Homalodisca vitripennis]